MDKPDIFDRIFMLPPLRRLNGFYQKHRSVLLYLLFGGLTTLVSIGSFMAADLVMHELIANLVSWICAVAFAYVTNRIWVFRSHTTGGKLVREILAFVGGRLFSLGVEELMLLVLVTKLRFHATLIKVVAQIVVLILNYVLSKLLVFRKK